MKYGFGIKIDIGTDTAFPADTSVGLYNASGRAVFKWSSDTVSGWTAGVLADDFGLELNNSADIEDGGNIAEIGGLRLQVVNAGQLNEWLDENSAYLDGRKAEVVEIALDSLAETTIWTGVCDGIAWDAERMTIGLRSPYASRNAQTIKTYDEDSEYPAVWGVVPNAIGRRVTDTETEVDISAYVGSGSKQYPVFTTNSTTKTLTLYVGTISDWTSISALINSGNCYLKCISGPNAGAIRKVSVAVQSLTDYINVSVSNWYDESISLYSDVHKFYTIGADYVFDHWYIGFDGLAGGRVESGPVAIRDRDLKSLPSEVVTASAAEGFISVEPRFLDNSLGEVQTFKTLAADFGDVEFYDDGTGGTLTTSSTNLERASDYNADLWASLSWQRTTGADDVQISLAISPDDLEIVEDATGIYMGLSFFSKVTASVPLAIRQFIIVEGEKWWGTSDVLCAYVTDQGITQLYYNSCARDVSSSTTQDPYGEYETVAGANARYVYGITRLEITGETLESIRKYDRIRLRFKATSTTLNDITRYDIALRHAAVTLALKSDIKDELVASVFGRGYSSTWSSTLTSPNAILAAVRGLQNFTSDNVTPPTGGWGLDRPSGILPIKTGGEAGSHFSLDVDISGVSDLTCGRNITSSADGWTEDLARTLCRNYWMLSWVGTDGKDNVVPILNASVYGNSANYTLEDTTGEIDVEERTARSAYLPNVRYAFYDGGPTKKAQFTRIGESGLSLSAKAAAVIGFPSYSDAAKALLWDAVEALRAAYGTLGEPPREMADLLWVQDEATAWWYVEKWVSWMMPRRKYAFTVPYDLARGVDVGSYIGINFPHETDGQDYTLLVTSVSRSISDFVPTATIEGWEVQSVDESYILDTYSDTDTWQDVYTDPETIQDEV